VAAASALFPGVLAAEAGSGDPLVSMFFYDTELAAGQWFARELARNGADAIGATGDWTHAWSRHVDPIWRKRPAAIAGVTPHGPMFMFAQLAQRHGMRLVYEAEIMQRANGCGIRVRGLQSVADACGVSPAGASNWPEDLARSFLAVTGSSVARSARIAAGTEAGPHEDPVYGWIIAPVSGAARYI